MPLEKEGFKAKIGKKQVELFKLVNINGLTAFFTNYGARLVALFVPNQNGVFQDIVLGFNNLQGYLNAEEKYFGATVGRYCNRIANGRFKVNGKSHQLTINNGKNCLHGGDKGFHEKVWEIIEHKDFQLKMKLDSKDGEEGFPGNMSVFLTITLSEKNELIFEYLAKTDKPSPINLTYHSYFNLRGEGNGTVSNHLLQINANFITPVNKNLVPTGDVLNVEGTPFDFLEISAIGNRIEAADQQIKFASGYDHNFVLKGDRGSTKQAAKVIEPDSGRIMEVFTTEPGIQLYTANWLSGNDIGKEGKSYKSREAFCLETQHYPDSPNQPDFPNTILKPGETFQSKTIYKFGLLSEKEQDE